MPAWRLRSVRARASATAPGRNVKLGGRIAESGTKDLSASASMTYELDESVVLPVSSPRGSRSPCPHHWSPIWLATGSASSLITARTAMTSIASPLFEEAVRYTGLHLENDLVAFRVLVGDASAPTSGRSVVPGRPRCRRARRSAGRRVFEPLPHAESWVESQPSLRPLSERNARARRRAFATSSFRRSIRGILIG